MGNFLDNLRSLATSLLGSSRYTITPDSISKTDGGPGAFERFGSNIRSLTDYISKPPSNVLSDYSPSPVPTRQPTSVPAVQGASSPPPPPVAAPRNPNASNFAISAAVRDAINKAAVQYNIPPNILYDIALQESSFNPGMKNETPEGVQAGVPQGLFQITPSTMNTVKNYAQMPGSSLNLPDNIDLLDPYTNSIIAAYLISHGQLGRWNASQNVWGPNYSYDEVAPYYSQTDQQYIPQENWR